MQKQRTIDTYNNMVNLKILMLSERGQAIEYISYNSLYIKF